MAGECATTLLLVRHGQVEGIDPPRFRGHRDLPLTPAGAEQAQRVARRISHDWEPEALYTSPLQRCVKTSEPIAAACGLTPVTLDALIDFNYGELTWEAEEDVQSSAPEFYAAWRTQPELVRFPGGDAIQDVVARSADALRLALEKHAGRTTIFVTHDSVLRCLLLQLAEMPISAYWRIDQSPCCINEVSIAGTKVCIRRVNDTNPA
jgi:phosphoserine phosphatase